MKLVMTKGLPASGKTTWAKTLVTKKGYKRINKDDLRAMLDDKKWSKEREKFILKTRDNLILSCFEANQNIIVDDTNLAPKHEATLRAMVNSWNKTNKLKKNHYEFEVKDFTDVPVDVCIKRDLARCPSVGEQVIKDMYKQFLKPKSEALTYDTQLDEAVVCDIDGTLALFGDNNPYVRDFSVDEVNYPVRNLIMTENHSSRNSGQVINFIFVSGRSDKFKKQTKDWLEKHLGFIEKYSLFMRKEGDNRKDSIVKREIYDKKIAGKYNVKYVLDDRNQVVEMWRSLGLTVLQVADGDF